MSHSRKETKKKARAKPRWGLRIFLGVLLIVLGVGIWAWTNRYDLAETKIRQEAAKLGVEIQLNIRSANKHSATIDNLRLMKAGDTLALIKTARLDYAWRDLLDGQFEKITIHDAIVDITLNADGQLAGGWADLLPPDTPRGNGAHSFEIPKGGIEITDAVVNWNIPGARGATQLDAEVYSLEKWNIHFANAEVSETSKLDANSNLQNITYNGVVETKDAHSFTAIGSLNLPEFTHNDMTALAPKIDYSLNFISKPKSSVVSFDGWTHMSTRQFGTPAILSNAPALKLDLSGGLGLGSRKIHHLKADWNLKTKATTLRDPVTRKYYASMLVSDKSLKAIPIAQHFSGFFVTKAERLMEAFAVDGKGSFSFTPEAYQVSLSQPLQITAAGEQKNQLVTVHQIKDTPVLHYKSADSDLSVLADINWSGARPLNVETLRLHAVSNNGVSLNGIKSISGHLKSPQTWTFKNTDGVFRLAPFAINLDYSNKLAAKYLSLNGAIDYDGTLPGGYVKGFSADANVNMKMQGSGFILGFKPNAPVTINRFSNSSGWQLNDLKFNVVPQDKLLEKKSNTTLLRTQLKDVQAQLRGPNNLRHLSMNFAGLEIMSDIAQTPQQWQMTATQSTIMSNDFPAPGTHITTPMSVVNVTLPSQNNSDLSFTLSSPTTEVRTDNAQISNLKIDLSGTPNDIAMSYDAGAVTMLGETQNPIPVLPMHGTARLKAGALSGEAITNLPRTKDTPIYIDYTSQDGQGAANIRIPKIVFDPKGLQPQQLVPALRGKLARVTGTVAAEFSFVFGGGRGVKSTGWADLTNLDIGTLVGPLTGVDSKLEFTSIFPLQTKGVQTAYLAGFDPGFLLKNGTIKFEVTPEGIAIHDARWPIANVTRDENENAQPAPPGFIYIDPTLWQFGDVENRVVIGIENVGLDAVLVGIKNEKFTATGQVDGKLPATIKGVYVMIDNGILRVNDGGVIRYKSTATDAAATRNENAERAFKALENFHYKKLEATINGPLDGEMALKLVFDGKNPDLLSGQKFQFNTSIVGELSNIIRSLSNTFSNEKNLQRILEMRDANQKKQDEIK